jgi:hypothetical protein
LRKNDQIVGIDSSSVRYFDELQKSIGRHENKTVLLAVLRNGQPVNFPAQVDSSGKLGFFRMVLAILSRWIASGWLKLNTTKYGFFCCVSRWS